jgi:hypothetical protein
VGRHNPGVLRRSCEFFPAKFEQALMCHARVCVDVQLQCAQRLFVRTGARRYEFHSKRVLPQLQRLGGDELLLGFDAEEVIDIMKQPLCWPFGAPLRGAPLGILNRLLPAYSPE